MHNPDWLTFLETQGAQIKDGITQRFGLASEEILSARDNTVLCDLSQFGILKVSGEDAQSFLQNICSNDVKAINSNLAQLNSLNTAKGRVLATFLLWQNGSDYFLHLPHELLASIQKKLLMYVLRSKVKVEDVSTQWVSLGLSGKEAGALLKSPLNVPQETILAVAQNATTSTIRVGNDRFLIITSCETAIELWQQLGAHAIKVGSPCWDWLNIRAGIPVIQPPTQEQFVLQMLNLDILNGVSFKKGCYPGQEIVARMHYLGKLKQRTFFAHVESDLAPQPNDSLYSDDFPGQSSGNIVNSAFAPHGGYDVLATLHTGSVKAQQQVHWKTPDGTVLNFGELPYSFPPEKAA
jgi:folate-binding protein YgfZ